MGPSLAYPLQFNLATRKWLFRGRRHLPAVNSQATPGGVGLGLNDAQDMSALIYLLSKKQQEHGLVARLAQGLAKCSEFFWFMTSLLLFMLLGPFSAVIVVVALFSLAKEKHVKEQISPTAQHNEVKGGVSV